VNGTRAVLVAYLVVLVLGIAYTVLLGVSGR
jgi:hypothetical protein